MRGKRKIWKTLYKNRIFSYNWKQYFYVNIQPIIFKVSVALAELSKHTLKSGSTVVHAFGKVGQVDFLFR